MTHSIDPVGTPLPRSIPSHPISPQKLNPGISDKSHQEKKSNTFQGFRGPSPRDDQRRRTGSCRCRFRHRRARSRLLPSLPSIAAPPSHKGLTDQPATARKWRAPEGREREREIRETSSKRGEREREEGKQKLQEKGKKERKRLIDICRLGKVGRRVGHQISRGPARRVFPLNIGPFLPRIMRTVGSAGVSRIHHPKIGTFRYKAWLT